MKQIAPGQTIGIIGGGQLGRMLAISAKQMGFRIAVLDPASGGPTAQVADIAITASYDDKEAAAQLKDVSDVITYEFENIDATILSWLNEEAYLPQGDKMIQTTQDRAFEKQAIEQSGAQVVAYECVHSIDELKRAIKWMGLPAIVKTRRFGYDGKGQVRLNDEADIVEAIPLFNQGPCIVEQFLPFEKEISVMVVRSTKGEMMTFPVAENSHVNHILHQSIVPARISETVQKKAEKIALKLAESLNLVGTLGVEMFVSKDGALFINEVAPRPHNSAHYTMDACQTSQFEQHIRAICGWTLGDGVLHSPVVMVNVLGQHVESVVNELPAYKQAKLHLYGKAEAKQNRKMGHVNILGTDTEQILQQIDHMDSWRS